eukprot:GFUD01044579.1.p1 GENE.GFUD01044579.1~~GFUD01044579.1.p1  ORF type:complete len:285 (+),score=42.87 GFUD01044579.1:121-975(+)
MNFSVQSDIHLKTNPFKTFQLIFGLVFLVPIRFPLSICTIVISWAVAKLSIIGIPEKDLKEVPLQGWRKVITRGVSRYIGSVLLMSMGIRLRIIGKQASRGDAPILVLAPHMSCLDALMLPVILASPVSREENRERTFMGSLLIAAQTIFVNRDSQESRLRTKEKIKERATSPQDWPQIFICPEGLNTDGKTLKKFKTGAFIPGVSVQPISVHHSCNQSTWAWHNGYGYILSILPVLASLSTTITLEFLPVYSPGKQEKKDSKLFANNVRNYIGKHLDINVNDI